MSKRYLDGQPVMPRVYRWGLFRWRGYLGSTTPGLSDGLCPGDHWFRWAALRCARQLAETMVHVRTR